VSPGQGPFRTPSPPEVRPEPPPSIGAFRLRCASLLWAEQITLIVGLPIFGGVIGSRFGGLELALESAGLSAVIALVGVLVLRARGIATIDLHEDGLVLHRLRGTRQIAFDDVDLVFVSVQRSGLPPNLILGTAIVLTLHGGERVDLAGGKHLEALVEPLRRRCSMPLVEPARVALAAGDLARFGPVTLAREGVRVNAADKPWSDLGRVTIEPEEITFYDARGRVWRAVAVRRVPHVSALATLLADKTRVERTGA
jgi:hypothetical protein